MVPPSTSLRPSIQVAFAVSFLIVRVGLYGYGIIDTLSWWFAADADARARLPVSQQVALLLLLPAGWALNLYVTFY